MGSIRRFARRKRGVEAEKRVGRIELSRVGVRRDVGQVQVARSRRQGRMERGFCDVGVIMRL